ncbi:MAG: ABC transporter permease [Clostridia bacterium]|nr:ABC transporter permease [Clostridia bacterium]
MKQFSKILKFELLGYFTNKIFVGVTVLFMVIIMGVMSIPRIISLFDDDTEGGEVTGEAMTMVIAGDGAEIAHPMFASMFTGYEVVLSGEGVEDIKEKITSGEIECAFVLRGLTSYTYYVNNLSLYDSNTALANEALITAYRLDAMASAGLSPEDAAAILSMPIESETESLGKDQMENFMYTYIMIFALYMVILLYGQMVASSVATEKSSRAMELLITSASPTAMMFGKVVSACIAGLTQLIAIFGTALIFYGINKDVYAEDPITDMLFNMPLDLFLYMLLFFVLGFLIYAFLFGAVGSTASKLEDINTCVMPITLVFIAGFMVVVFSMSSGEIDNTLMRICSYIPFTSPMAMFTRIAMSVVPAYEIIISVAILIGSVIGTGIISAKIYRVGVMLYGTPPKLGAIIKAIRKA